MAVIHISEEEAAKNLGSLVTRAAQGDDIVIDGPTSSAKLVAHGRPKPRSGAEILAILESLPGERGVMDADFARDVRQFRENHPESLDGSKWD